ncbi:polyhydroxybutyrate depolymerase [Parvibaculum indicum]|uniref:alpha/beta hydrolase family esterase n=1 Tax=Parvibaculum indicum TaxID=562969 RepID=UPI001423B5E0|nr:PHB depolymerase family esterase [Parvibaculum indicum]NIJ40061.1 polyhydroxybutyrate depolymerase [Parvibaculum indicum]
MKIIRLAACLCLLSLAGVTAARAATIDVDGTERNYLIFRTADLPLPAPTVIVLHGGGGGAERMAAYNGFGDFAREHGILAIYPEAIDHFWNDGRKDERGAASDDTGFLRALIRTLVAEGLADPSRIYLTGMSNGGMMTLHMACTAPGLFAAIAVVAASQPQDVPCPVKQPLPVLLVNGTDDGMVPYKGGPVGKGWTDRGRVIGHENTLRLWARANDCSQMAATAPLPDTARDGMRSTETVFDCPADTAVIGITVEGGDHSWPGGSRGPIARMLLGPVTRDFSANRIIWNFFKPRARAQ